VVSYFHTLLTRDAVNRIDAVVGAEIQDAVDGQRRALEEAAAVARCGMSRLA
jgi:hypothetical protein